MQNQIPLLEAACEHSDGAAAHQHQHQHQRWVNTSTRRRPIGSDGAAASRHAPPSIRPNSIPGVDGPSHLPTSAKQRTRRPALLACMRSIDRARRGASPTAARMDRCLTKLSATARSLGPGVIMASTGGPRAPVLFLRFPAGRIPFVRDKLRARTTTARVAGCGRRVSVRRLGPRKEITS